MPRYALGGSPISLALDILGANGYMYRERPPFLSQMQGVFTDREIDERVKTQLSSAGFGIYRDTSSDNTRMRAAMLPYFLSLYEASQKGWNLWTFGESLPGFEDERLLDPPILPFQDEAEALRYGEENGYKSPRTLGRDAVLSMMRRMDPFEQLEPVPLTFDQLKKLLTSARFPVTFVSETQHRN